MCRSLPSLLALVALLTSLLCVPARAQLCEDALSDPGDRYGTIVDVRGERALVTALEQVVAGVSGAGVVHTYERIAGDWMPDGVLASPTPRSFARFGTSACVHGTTAFVGEPVFNDGRVYVFERQAGTWTVVQTLVGDNDGLEQFGHSLDFDGERLVVGTRRGNSAFVFENQAGVWTRTARLEGPNPIQFGNDVAIDGDELAVGDPSLGVNGGRVVTFRRVGSAWVQRALIDGDGFRAREFGWAVDLEADTLVVGAWADGISNRNGGEVSLYRLIGNDWELEQHIPAPDPLGGSSVGPRFGWSVDLDGRFLAVGAENAVQDPIFIRHGAVWVFERTPRGWMALDEITKTNPANHDGFGNSVAMDRGTLLVGTLSADRAFFTGSCYDCNDNGTDDVLDLASGTSADCDGNGVPDSCDLAFANDPDCDRDGQLDFCGIASGALSDCNANTVPDLCDVERGLGRDCDGNGRLDDCDFPFAVRFCVCDTGAPCSNPYPLGGCRLPEPRRLFGEAERRGAQIGACGSASVAADDLVISVAHAAQPLAPGGVACFLMGDPVAPAPFGSGIACVGDGGSGLFLLPVPHVRGRRPRLGPGLAARTQMDLPPGGHIAAGQTWAFQLMYRVGPFVGCGNGFGLSDAVSISFAP